MKKPMHHLLPYLWVVLLVACTTPATPTPASTTISTAVSSPTATAVPVADPQPVTFTTPDNATLHGEIYGSGNTAVIFSVMGNCKQGWPELAKEAAQQGVRSLTYLWRGCKQNGSVDEASIQKFVEDTRGAINFMRAQGATQIILVGASLGGCASAKLLTESGADGLVVLASPPEIAQWGFQITAEDLDTTAPKLFITAENDPVVSSSATRELFDLSAEPKEWQTYPGEAHGTDLFETENKDALSRRILDFILLIQGS